LSRPDARNPFHPSTFFAWLHAERRDLWHALSLGDFKVLWELCDACTWATGLDAFRSLERMMHDAGLSKTTVVKAIAHLRELGLVAKCPEGRRTASGQTVSTYAVRFPAGQSSFCTPSKGSNSRAKGVQKLDRRCPVSGQNHGPDPGPGTKRGASHSGVMRSGSETEPLAAVLAAVGAGRIREARHKGVVYRAQVSDDGQALLLTHLTSGHQVRIADAGRLRTVELVEGDGR